MTPTNVQRLETIAIKLENIPKEKRNPITADRGWWFFPEDGRVDAIPLVPRHSTIRDIRDICLATLAERLSWRPGKETK